MTTTVTLAIESSNPGPEANPGAIALRTADARLHTRALAPGARHDDALMPAIDALCTQCAVAPADLQRVAVSAGPGGYTAVRIALATAKLLCEATGADCVPVPTAEVALRASTNPDDSDRDALVCLAWKRDSVWTQRYTRADPARPHEPALTTLADLASLPETLLIAHPALLQRLADLAPALDTRALRLDPAYVVTAADHHQPVDPALAAPIYPREPEAVALWRTRPGR